jgi:hybrid cluster-associated redox disulfide protein
MAEEKSKPEKGAKAEAITKDMPIQQIVMEHPETAEVFMKHGMHCIGCVAARFENLEQGCAAHGIDVDAMVKDLNKAVEKGKKG